MPASVTNGRSIDGKLERLTTLRQDDHGFYDASIMVEVVTGRDAKAELVAFHRVGRALSVPDEIRR